MQNPLAALLSLTHAEKERRGLLHTPREISQQPETWLATLDYLSSVQSALVEFMENFFRPDGTGRQPEIILAGAGTSDYIGRAVAGILRKQLRCGVSAIAGTELLTGLDELVFSGKRYLLVSFSRSGDSSEGVAVLENALKHYPEEITHLLVTCNRDGRMVRIPGIFSLVLDARVNDSGLAMTSSFTNMLIAGQYLAFAKSPAQFESLVRQLARTGSQKMAEAAEITARLAARGFSRVCFLGTGPLQAAAEESSLKVLELNAGRIATIAQSALGIRHGPLSFVNDETLVVAYVSGDEERQRYELDLLEEMQTKRLGGEILVVVARATERVRRRTKTILALDALEDFPDFCRPAVDVLVGQLLGLFFAIENGITPDSPSTGAISRVVSHVKIYPPGGEKRER